jgi:hypothetical protein
MSPNARRFSFASINEMGFAAAAFPMIILTGSMFWNVRESVSL